MIVMTLTIELDIGLSPFTDTSPASRCLSAARAARLSRKTRPTKARCIQALALFGPANSAG
jgi:hypothetical protein